MRYTSVVASAFALLSAVALLSSAAYLDTVFTVSLPSGDGEYWEPVRYEDVVYVASDGGTVTAVNLTSHSTKWISPNLTKYGSIDGFGVCSSQAVLVSFSILPGETPTVVALNTSTGAPLWSGAFQLSFPVACFSSGSSIYAFILGYEYPAVRAFDLATGEPGSMRFSSGIWIYGDTVFTVDLQITRPWGTFLRAIDISASETLWTSTISSVATGGEVLAANERYVAISNVSGYNNLPIVLHRENGTLARAFAFILYPDQDFVVAFFGDELFALIGDENPRYVLVDVATGNITWTLTYSPALICNGRLVTLDSTHTLTIVPIGTSAAPITVPNVQMLYWADLVDFGYGVLQVPNPHGYTLWDVNTGMLLENNTKYLYSAEPMTPFKWEGISVTMFGSNVTGVKLVP